jgi:hypothetical protein
MHVLPGTRPLAPVAPGVAVVTTEHCRIVAGWDTAA